MIIHNNTRLLQQHEAEEKWKYETLVRSEVTRMALNDDKQLSSAQQDELRKKQGIYYKQLSAVAAAKAIYDSIISKQQ